MFFIFIFVIIIILKDSEDVGHSWAKLELEDGKTVHSRLVVHLFWMLNNTNKKRNLLLISFDPVVTKAS